jgi:putative ABC transport system permease protein
VAIAVAQRRHEVGVLRALGETRSGMVWLFMLESVILAIPGALIGLALGRALSRLSVASTLETLDSIFLSASQLAPALGPGIVLRAGALAMLMALVAAYFPARRGTAFDPAIVLRGASAVELRKPPVRLLLGLAVICACASLVPVFEGTALGGFLQLAWILASATLATPAFVIAMRAVCVRAVDGLFGIPGRLGLDYVARTLSRSTINVLALMVAVGMSISVSSWLGSFERSLTRWAEQVGTANLTVTRGSPVLDRRHVALLDGTVEQVRGVPGVVAVQRFRMLDQRLRGVKLRLVATDTAVFLGQSQLLGKGWEYVAGKPLAADELVRERSVVLSENAARLLHVTAGDNLSLPTPEGHVQVAVRAVVVDFTSETGTAFIDLAQFHRYFHDTAVDGLSVYVDPKRRLGEVEDAVRAAVSSNDRDATMFVTQNEVVQRHLLDTLQRSFSYSRAVELMTLIIGLLGVIGTMIAAVLDRQRELGMLRAVGATRGQVAAAIVVEAGFLGLCAALAGILVGVAETQVFFRTLVATTTGWHLTFAFPWESALRTTFLVVATSALAGVVPALRALRHEVVGAPGVE